MAKLKKQPNHKQGMHAKMPHYRKKGPGRYHRQGKK